MTETTPQGFDHDDATPLPEQEQAVEQEAEIAEFGPGTDDTPDAHPSWTPGPDDTAEIAPVTESEEP